MRRLREKLATTLLFVAHYLTYGVGRPRKPLLGPRPGPHWRGFSVTIRETRVYGITVFGWSRDHAEEKAHLI